MLLSLIMFCLLIIKTTSKFIADKIVLELSSDEIPISNIPFPAITMCPQIFQKDGLPHFDGDSYIASNDKCEIYNSKISD